MHCNHMRQRKRNHRVGHDPPHNSEDHCGSRELCVIRCPPQHVGHQQRARVAHHAHQSCGHSEEATVLSYVDVLIRRPFLAFSLGLKFTAVVMACSDKSTDQLPLLAIVGFGRSKDTSRSGKQGVSACRSDVCSGHADLLHRGESSNSSLPFMMIET